MVFQQLKIICVYQHALFFIMWSYNNPDWKKPQNISSPKQIQPWGQISYLGLCLRPSLVLKSLKDKDCITSLYSLPHCLTVLGVKMFLLISRWILSCSKFWALSLILPPSLWAAWLSCFHDLLVSTWDLLLGPPKLLAFFSSLHRASAPNWNSLQFASVSCWARDPKLESWFQSHKGWGEVPILLWAFWLCCSRYSPGCSCPSLQPGHTADSHPPCYLQAPANPSQQGCSKAAPPQPIKSQPVSTQGLTLSSSHTWHFFILIFIWFLLAYSSSLPASLWMAIPPSSMWSGPMVWFHLHAWWLCTPLTSSRLLKKWESYLKSNL